MLTGTVMVIVSSLFIKPKTQAKEPAPAEPFHDAVMPDGFEVMVG